MQLTVHNLSKRILFRTVLRDVSFQIPSGTVTALLGANGTGKTTLLRLLGCIYSPSSGDIQIDGERLNRGRLDLRRRLRLISDQNVNKLPLNVLDYLVYVAGLYGRTSEEIQHRALELMERWELLELFYYPIASLSRGQAYKVEMASIELCDPELWMLDEPFASGMDPAGLKQLSRSIAEARARNRIVLFSTQIAQLAQSNCDRVLILHQSSLVADGTIAELMSPDAVVQYPMIANLLKAISE